MTETSNPDKSNEEADAPDLDTIGQEYDVYREDDEDDQTYGDRILAQLESSIDELLEVQGRVQILLA